MTQNTRDALQRFSFDDTDIRGEIALLDSAFGEVIRRHSYPAVVSRALGELMAATALLSTTLKFAARLTLQIRLPGNVSLLQAETNEQGQLRGIARYDENVSDDELNFTDGSMVITIEPEQGQRYQGITSINGGNVAAALEDYFAQSEQLPSRFWLFSDGKTAAGLMLQKMPTPVGKEEDADAWDRVCHLASTVREDEMLGLPTEEVLHRLFNQEQTRVHPVSPLSFSCTCSKPRTASALMQLGYDELMEVIAERGKIDITCEFCQQNYVFDKAQVDELFPERHPH
ncbi:Hsp33 family molecular chaperone HslO [Thalassolituus sp. LLYu03]|uniref:Hsp33 family molecular chaperone HslO n=1 Tax=Thalassolituus sp. LLYu03 TaxID=3421656 RepID=UPI003D2D5568